MSIDALLLGAIVGAFIFVPTGYIVRVLLSRTTEIPSRPPMVSEIYESLDRHRDAINEHGTSFGQVRQEILLLESKLQLMSTEMADFFDKTRKSEERQRGLTRRAEAAIGDEENTELQDQQLLELMEEQKAELTVDENLVPMTREQYYKQHST